MELIQQIEEWQRQLDERPAFATHADLDVAQRLVRHGAEALREIERLRGLLGCARVPIGHDDAPLLQPCPHCDKPIEIGADRRARKSAFFEADADDNDNFQIHTCDDSPECAACDAAVAPNDQVQPRAERSEAK